MAVFVTSRLGRGNSSRWPSCSISLAASQPRSLAELKRVARGCVNCLQVVESGQISRSPLCEENSLSDAAHVIDRKECTVETHIRKDVVFWPQRRICCNPASVEKLTL